MAVYTHLDRGDVEELAEQYGLGLIGFEALEAGAGNSNYLLDTDEGAFVLTVFEDKEEPHVQQIALLLLLLADHDFATTRLKMLRDGALAARHGAKPVLVKEFIAGQVHRHLDETMLMQTGATMARLHTIPAPELLPDEHAYGLEVFDTALGHDIDASYEAWLAQRLERLAGCVPADLPRGLIHGDVFYDNVLFEGKRLKAIIDFEQACHSYFAFDLGVAIVGLCAAGSTISLDRIGALVRGYQTVRTLDRHERTALQGCADYAASATSAWRYWKYNVDTPIAAKATKHREMARLADAIRAIPEARFLDAVSL